MSDVAAEIRAHAEEATKDMPEPSENGRQDRRTLTDTGNASRLVQLHGEQLHYIPPWSKWLVCGGDRFWTVDHDDVRVRELAKDVGRRLVRQAADADDKDRSDALHDFGWKTLNAYKIGNLVNLARGIEGIPLEHERLDADGWLLGCANGVVDLRSGELRDADPADLITRRSPVAYDAGAEATRWRRAMREWFPDSDVRDYVHRVAGAALVGGQRDHTLIIHYGTGRNGKGTFVRALQRVLGDYGSVIHLSLLVQTRHSEHDTVKAELFRTRLAVASETERRVRLNESSVKNLTGGDRITARRMREDPWEFDPTHSLWLQTNHLPEIAGRDTGIWSRIRVVKWETTFKGDDQDQDLDATLEGEAPGILRWLVEGCLAWQKRGLDEPEAVKRETLAYRNSQDKIARFRDDVGLVLSDDLRIPRGELQTLLTDWAEAEGMKPPRKQINDWLNNQGVQAKRLRVEQPNGEKKQVRFWVGAGIDDENHRTEQTSALA